MVEIGKHFGRWRAIIFWNWRNKGNHENYFRSNDQYEIVTKYIQYYDIVIMVANIVVNPVK